MSPVGRDTILNHLTNKGYTDHTLDFSVVRTDLLVGSESLLRIFMSEISSDFIFVFIRDKEAVVDELLEKSEEIRKKGDGKIKVLNESKF